MRSLWNRRTVGERSRRGRSSAARGKWGSRLRIEPLEDRRLLAVFTVDDLSDTVLAGDGKSTLREAIAAANSTSGTDRIAFAPSLAGTITLTGGELAITDAVKIDGPGASVLTIDGNDASRIFRLDASTAISGLTLTGGNAAGGDGGAILSSATLALANTVVHGNRATLTGGGVALDAPAGAVVQIVGCLISDNIAAEDGGGIFASNRGALDIRNSTISGNVAGLNGGGLYTSNRAGATTIQSSTISGNSAYSGGGIFNQAASAAAGSAVTILASTISGNRANESGGGVYSNDGANAITIQNSTIADNMADADKNAGGAGGGVYVKAGTIALTSTIVAENEDQSNTAPDVYGPVAIDHCLVGIDAGADLDDGGGNLVGATADPFDAELGPLADNGGPTWTHALLSGSPALDAGSNPAGLTTDQRGAPFARVVGSAIDIGASERQAVSGLSLVVSTTADESDGDYSSGDLSLREAIGLANGSVGADTITFAAGLSGTITLQFGELRIVDSLTLEGPGAEKLTISGDNASRIFNIDDDDPSHPLSVAISGLTLVAGNAGNEDGGAIFSSEGLILRNSVVSGSTALAGGGLYCTMSPSGTTLIENSVFSDNHATDLGGGLHLVNLGTTTVRRSIISGNEADSLGGGLYISNSIGTTLIQESTISGNEGDSGGIEIDNGGGKLTIDGCTVSGNHGDVGGGISLSFASDITGTAVTVQNSTVSGNVALSGGGGVYLGLGSLAIRNSTITGNTCRTGDTGYGQGGGLYLSPLATATAIISSSIVAGNTDQGDTNKAPDISGTVTIDHSLVGNSSGATLNGSDGNLVGVDPKLGPLQDNGGPTWTHALLTGSPAIDAGVNPSALAYDQRGVGFPRESALAGTAKPDMGAYELQGPPTAQFAVTSQGVSEGAGTLTVTVQLSSPASSQVSIPVTFGGTATQGTDYTVATSTITIGVGQSTGALTVTLVDENRVEADETVIFTLGQPTGALLGSNITHTATIVNNDSAVVNLVGASANEATGKLDFTVTLSNPVDVPVTVTFATLTTGTATAGVDFTALSGRTVTFAAGSTTAQVVSVTVIDDQVVEPNETVAAQLSGLAAGGRSVTLGTASATGTILNDDSATLSINDVTIVEGTGGAKNAVFTVSLSKASQETVTVNYATANGTATAGSDYTEKSGQLTFTPGGALTQTISIPITTDALDETNETFMVNLTGATGATIADAQGIATITDDDDAPTLAIGDVTVTEGTGGTVNLVFTVTMTGQSASPVTVNYATADGTAKSPADYTAKSGQLTFAPGGAATQTITVTVQSDAIDEDNETLAVNLSGATNATIADAQGIGTITDDDAAPSLVIGDVTIAEGTGGTTNAVFTVTLSAASGRTVTVNYATAAQTAVAPADFTQATGQLTFAPGETTKTITVAISPDARDEDNETLAVNLSGATNATIADGQGIGTITDDDAPPTLSINDVQVTEGNDGTVNAVFTVTLSAESGKSITVAYATADGTAKAPADYTATSGQLTFAPGEMTKTISVPLVGDLLDELNETFNVNLSSPANATIADGQAVATIVDNDPAPMVAFTTATQSVGENGGATTITASLSAPSALEVTVPFTVSGTATRPGHYTITSSPLAIAPGATTATITVTLVDNAIDDGDRTVIVTMGTPANAVAQGTTVHTATITDNDDAGITVAPTSGLTTTEAGGEATFTVVLDAQPTANVTIGLSSSDTTEGTVTPTSLTFTPANWNAPQTVTVRGVNDPVADGPTSYTIVTAAATSTDANYNGMNAADVAVSNTDDEPVATNLGKILFTAIGDLDLGNGDRWYKFQTSYAGLFTLAVSGTDVQMTVYDADFNVLQSAPTTDGSLRLDRTVEAGAAGYLKFHGSGAGVDLCLVNLVSPAGDTVTVHGTSGADAFTFATDESHEITIKGVPYSFDPDVVSKIVFDGAGGRDSAILAGTPGTDSATLKPGIGIFNGPGFGVTLLGTEDVTVDAGSGATPPESETALLYGGNGDNTFEAGPTQGTLSGEGFTFTAIGFDYLHGMAEGGNDTAVLHGSDGDDQMTGRGNYAQIRGEDFLVRARGFDKVTCNAQEGVDTAFLFDGAKDDTFTGTTTQSTMVGSGVNNTVVGFDYVHAFSRTGGYDTATMVDSPGTDKFVAKPQYSYLVGETYFYRANRFEEVRAYGSAGGDNVAWMYDSPGDDAFTTGVYESEFKGADFLNVAIDFKSAYAYATAGGYDTAELHDAPGVTALWVKPTSTTLSGAGFFRRAEGFDHLYAQSDDGLDYTEVTDSAADDLLTAVIENGKTKVSMKYAVEKDAPGYKAALDYYYEAIGFKFTKATSVGGTDQRNIASDVPAPTWIGEWEG